MSAEAALILIGLVLAVVVLDRLASSSTALPVTAAAPSAGESRPPLTGDPRALMLAGRAGDVLVGLAVGRGLLDATVVPADQTTLSASAVRITADGRRLRPTSCGASCFTVPVAALKGSPVALAVTVDRPGKQLVGARFRLPARPPARADAVLARAERRMHELRSVRVDETLSSGLATVHTRFELLAPDRMRYAIAGGGRAVVIGSRRWDLDNGRWRESPYQRLSEPSYIWDGASRARLLGAMEIGGEPVRVLGAFRPSADFPAWFRLAVTRDGRVLRAEMLAPAHFMVDRFGRLDRPLSIEPPR